MLETDFIMVKENPFAFLKNYNNDLFLFFYLNCPLVCFNVRNHKSSLYFTIFFYLQKEHELRKKNEGKNIRKEKNEVTDMLFSAFEQHQYYNVKDLIRITKQPIVSIYIFLCIF